MSYWTDRQEHLKEAAEKDEDKIKKRLQKVYDREWFQLEKEIAAYYQQYGEDNVIRYRSLLQQLSGADRTLLIERMEEFAKKYPQYADLMPMRESIYRLDRLQGLQYSVYMSQAEIAGYTAEQIRTYETTLARKGLNYAMETLGFGANFYAADSEMVKSFVDKAWCNGTNFSARIWEDTQKLAQYLSTDVAQGFVRGDSYIRLVKQLRQRFTRVNRRDAYRLIYTEGTYVMAEASIQPFLEDFTDYRLSPVMDGRTCPICRGLREQVFEMKDRQPGVNFPPLHPWCRCTWEPVVDDWGAWREAYRQRHGSTRAEKVEKHLRKDVGQGIIQLPRYQEAVIPREKFTMYALNPERDANKARAFQAALGYTLENVDDLISQIHEKLPTYNAVEKGDRGYGMTYEVVMDITGPNGKTAKVLTAWIDDKNNGELRLTTLHVDD